ncbi:MAG: MBL fold metallo-hydrolase [Betaproteobacteria bacterium]|nr:MBL fold metallo-hydrolase [Rubrivivax sp.]
MSRRPDGPAEGATRPVPRGAALLWTLALAATLAGCATVNPYHDPARPHHRPDGFNNLHVDNHRADAPSFWRWQWERLLGERAADELHRVRRVPLDAPLLHANRGDVTVTWIGHSTVLWQIGGLNILTDPHFGERASPAGFAGPRRLVPLPATLAALPRIDVVLLSHNHYDHLDRGTVHALAAQSGGPPLFVVPLGVDLWMRDEGIPNVRRMDWWDRVVLPGPAGEVVVHFVPVQHWSSRTPWDRHATLWGGYVVEGAAGARPYRMLFAGDTGYSPDFKLLGERFGGFDFSLIPVGCYEPRWFHAGMHVNEDEAVRIHLDVRSRLSLGIHWGTFRLCDEPVHAPLDELPRARARHGVPDEAFVLFGLGQTRVLAAAAR